MLSIWSYLCTVVSSTLINQLCVSTVCYPKYFKSFLLCILVRQFYTEISKQYNLLTIIPRARVGYDIYMVDWLYGRLAMTISCPTSASGIIVLLKTLKRIAIFSSPAVLVDAYRLRYFRQWYMSSYICTIAC